MQADPSLPQQVARCSAACDSAIGALVACNDLTPVTLDGEESWGILYLSDGRFLGEIHQ